jgi:hypothetical protein
MDYLMVWVALPFCGNMGFWDEAVRLGLIGPKINVKENFIRNSEWRSRPKTKYCDLKRKIIKAQWIKSPG